MNIININSPLMPTPSQISFCEDVILASLKRDRYIKRALLGISREIPIFLVDRETFDQVKFEDRFNLYHKNSDIKPATEALGYYTRETNRFLTDTPVIVLCPEKIEMITKTREEFTVIFAKVLIHELCHAALDHYGENALYQAVYGQDRFYSWMEEGCANAQTLDLFAYYMDDFHYFHRIKGHGHFDEPDAFKIVANFIKNQPDNYRFGLQLFRCFEIDGLCQEWSELKRTIGGHKEMKANFLEMLDVLKFQKNGEENHFITEFIQEMQSEL